MRQRAKAPSQGSISGTAIGRRLRRLGIFLAIGLAVCLASGLPSASAACPNEGLRTGLSANLPDCRAYELVTPEETGGAPILSQPFGMDAGAFPVPLASTAGGVPSVIFTSGAGALPGLGGLGQSDRYRSLRGDNGWATRLLDPPAGVEEAFDPSAFSPSGISTDHAYSFMATRPAGTPISAPFIDKYLRLPDGTIEPLGVGSLGVNLGACGVYISPDADHVIFTSFLSTETGRDCAFGTAAKLEPDAPDIPTSTVYDRTPGGPTHVVSLLPGDVTPAAGENSAYQGASADGSTVLFSHPALLEGPDSESSELYARVDNQETFEIASNSPALPVGGGLVCNADPDNVASQGFQWLRNGSPIPGATAPSYVTQAADAGTVVQCQAFTINANAGATQASNPPVVVDPAPATAPPVPPGSISQPSQSGALTVPGPAANRTLTCNPGAWSGAPTFTYQWFKDGVAIPGATASTHIVTAGSLTAPTSFQCAVTGTNAGGSVTKVSANRNSSPAPSPAAPVAAAATTDARVAPAGVSANGDHVFYIQAGFVHSFDTTTQTSTVVTDVGDAQLVNISADGSHAYFVSHRQIGGEGTAGQPNLFVWERGGDSIDFIATVAPKDLSLSVNVLGSDRSCLTCWTRQVTKRFGENNVAPTSGPGNNLSRTTPDGEVLVFESHAQLTAYDNEGHNEVYRYDTTNESMVCASCHPEGEPPSSDASLQSTQLSNAVAPVWPIFEVSNVSDDGRYVFFQTSDRLVAGDITAAQDVYQWAANGSGECKDPSGCVSLISSGKSPLVMFEGKESPTNLLYAASPDGQDVFIQTREQLLPQDRSDGSGAIYDARVNGGFAAKDEEEGCAVGEDCQATSAPPPAPNAASALFQSNGNVKEGKPRPRCPKGKRRVRRAGKTQCVKPPKRKAARNRRVSR